MSREVVLLDHRGKEIRPKNSRRRRARAAYDAARDTDELRNYWAHVDGLDADRANSKAVRQTLYRRSRQQSGSNAFYDGILETHCNMLVGVGPKLRITSARRPFNQFIEREFYRWWLAAGIRRKLWCSVHAKNQDGCGFGLLVNNPGLDNAVKLDVLLVETDQVTTPFLPFMQDGYIDGIRFDEFNNVLWYDVLPSHPGSGNTGMTQNPVRVPREQMLHLFKLKRPGQHRGIPSLTSSMNIGAMSHRFREATIAKAETQADYTAVIKTDVPAANFEEEEALKAFDQTGIDKRTLTVLPNQYDLIQLENDSPNAQYADFHRTQVSEMGRPLSQPYNVSAADSSTYSFASGKLDFLGYRAALDVEREDVNDLWLEPLFRMWFREWALVTGNRNVQISHEWAWPAHPIIDVVADATANDIGLKNGTRTLRKHFADAGSDYDDELAQFAMDYFGESTPEAMDKMRVILLRTNFPEAFAAEERATAPRSAINALRKELRVMRARLTQLESEFVKR